MNLIIMKMELQVFNIIINNIEKAVYLILKYSENGLESEHFNRCFYRFLGSF